MFCAAIEPFLSTASPEGKKHIAYTHTMSASIGIIVTYFVGFCHVQSNKVCYNNNNKNNCGQLHCTETFEK